MINHAKPASIIAVLSFISVYRHFLKENRAQRQKKELLEWEKSGNKLSQTHRGSRLHPPV
jgi:hypothetical protein